MSEDASAINPSYSLVAIDIDGTLIHEASPLSEANRDAIARALSSGVRIVLASGKSWAGMAPVAEILGIPGPHIAVNGTQIIGMAEEHAGLPPRVAEAAIEVARSNAIPWCVYLAEGFLVLSDTAVDELLSAGEPPDVLLTEPVDGRALKVLFCVQEGDARTEEILRQEINDPRCTFVRTSARFFELMPTGVNKGTALHRLLGSLGIGMERCLAIGDAENDIPMFNVAGLAVAAPLASDAAKGAAHVVVPSDQHPDAVAWALTRFVLPASA